MLLVLSDDCSLLDSARLILGAADWNCLAVGRIEDLLLAAAGHFPAAILIDLRSPDAAAAIVAIRELPAPANGTPVITVGKTAGLPDSVAGHLDLPLGGQALRTILEHWAGPLDDHALRAVPFSPRYRLIRLVGVDAAEGMLRRFEAELEAAIAGAASGPDRVRAHRLAGVAGLIGHEELGALWAEAERGGAEELARAVEASREVLRLRR